MFLPDSFINREAFDLRTKGKWKNEILEIFKCGNCALLFLGIPDAHTVLPDPLNLDHVLGYNRPQKLICPQCDKEVYNRRLSDRSKNEITPEEFLKSPWNWLRPA